MAESAVAREVASYLDGTEGAFGRGTDEYYARLALAAALEAFRSRNYGIGAVAVLRDHGRAREFLGGNAMVTGGGVIDHAETRAIMRILDADPPNAEYEIDPALEHGLYVFGTLEPCPMCACVLTNSGATRSVSTVEDGTLVRDGEFLRSGGAANVFGEKARTQPRIWHNIQTGRHMSFDILATGDSQLRSLSERIFLETREDIDRLLVDRTHVGHADRIRQSYEERLPRVSSAPEGAPKQ